MRAADQARGALSPPRRACDVTSNISSARKFSKKPGIFARKIPEPLSVATQSAIS